MSAPATPTQPAFQSGSAVSTLGNRFLLSAIAFQRSKQLANGAAARVASDGHKPTYVAVLEVLADTVSWSNDGDAGAERTSAG